MSLESSLRSLRQHALWMYPIQGACCGNEIENSFGARYDLERFGIQKASRPEEADVLVVSGAISYGLGREIREAFERMRDPKWVVAIGSCAVAGGLFSPKLSYSVVPGLDRLIPVDVLVPGCPPRPEAIMYGWLKLQERVSGRINQKSI